nr:putative RNA-directed DNA polymerase, eukaryota, reverse transcriptase zinc-binding domain protein [Tanacetum cinerariifolium]
MGTFRSKKDDVSRISTSIFVTNFLDSFYAKYLFHSCKLYGHVVDSFIPTKRTKEGKRFGFVRFINVFNVERLVNNLCTIWVGRLKLNANLARFNRENLKGNGNGDKTEKTYNKNNYNGSHKAADNVGIGKSFVNVVKGSRSIMKVNSSPMIVLDDECLNVKDLSCSIMGRVKELASLANLKKALVNEALNQASADFVPDGRIAWVEVEGIPLKYWSGFTFKRIASKWGQLLDVDDYDEVNFHSKRLCIHTKVRENILETIKIAHRGKVYWLRADEVSGWTPDFAEEVEEDDVSVEGNSDDNHNEHEVNNCIVESDMEEVVETVFDVLEGQKEDHLDYPPGFTPDGNLNEGHSDGDLDKQVNRENVGDGIFYVNTDGDKENSGSVNKKVQSTCSGRFRKSEIPRTGGSILSLMKEVVKVGLQETKMESIDMLSVRFCWGNLIFDHVHSESIGIDLLIVVVYAPQEAKEKRILWDYLTHVSEQWEGKIVMMGDFNEVRHKADRFGSKFNAHDAEIFNSFIYNVGLDEVPLGGSAYTWCHKSASKMNRIRSWLSSNRLNSKADILKLKEELRGFDMEIDKGNGSEELVHKRLEVLNKIQQISNIQTSKVAQKAKITWAVEGDENTKFFYGMLNKKRNQTNIRGVMVNGLWIDNPVQVKHEFFEHFRCRFDTPPGNRARIDICFPNSLSNDQRHELESMVTKEEVKRAVWDCDVFEAVDCFFKHGEMPNGCNSNFIALIPKILDANMVKDYHPISLIGSLYKIIAKILTNRLVGVIGDLVNEVQSAFVSERQILDGPFILNERNWIQSCLRSSRGSILINGSPTEEFSFFKGLKQGDSLSPFLFILVMESLHISFQRVVDVGLFTGIKLNSMVNLSHLFYADDAIFIGQWSDINIDTLVQVLDCFYRASGLKINMCKSKIMGVNVEDGKVTNAASKLGCLILKTPFTYLGTKVGDNMPRKEAWKEVVDKYHDDVSSFNSFSRHLHSTSYTIISRQPPPRGSILSVNDGQRRRSMPPATGQRRRITVVIGGQRWRSTTVAGGEPLLTAAGPPLTTTGPPVNGGWWAGQRLEMGRSGSGLGRVRHMACHVSATCAHVSATCAHVASTWMLTWILNTKWESNPGPLEDVVSRISTSIFVTNLLDSFSAKDLFHSCKLYGHVVDSFIPTKRTKEGKRFGFIRFINVFNVERLVNNLCTIWVGRLKLHANVARFNRENLKGNGNGYKTEKTYNKNNYNGSHKAADNVGIGKSFVNVVKGSRSIMEVNSSPTIVLDDECLNVKDISYSIMGRVKELASLANLKKALVNEGMNSWFSALNQASADFAPDGRIAWVEVEGIPFKYWSGSTFKRIASKWGQLLDVDDYDEVNFHSKRLCIHTKVRENTLETIKIAHRGKVYWLRANEVSGWTPDFTEEVEEDDVSMEGNNDDNHNEYEVNNCIVESHVEEVVETVFDVPKGLKENQGTNLDYPPGFTPDGNLNEGHSDGDLDKQVNRENVRDGIFYVNTDGDKENFGSVNKKVESTCSGRFKKSEIPRTGGSILSLMEEVVKVGLQETKMESIDMLSVRSCWGNLIFDHVHSESVSNSGGILCIWDPNSFRSSSVTRSDYFVIIRGVWLKSGIDLLIVVVYAPQEAKEKCILWDYLTYVSEQWEGEIVMMGDFNEVRHKADRFGSKFNDHDAEIFNSFIYNAGLDEVPLGGSVYTWCHKSASKMSKLDRFLVFENLLNSCRNINAITLDRYISDHRPIILHESMFDYGPIPFRFYNYWLEIDDRIRSWLSSNRLNSKAEISKLNEELRGFDMEIDKGNGSEELVHKRLEVLNKIQQISNIQTSKVTQKAKITWTVEGNENTKFFHGMLNKKRNQTNIRGVMVNGLWIDNLVQVKHEFFEHFRCRFDTPPVNRARIDICFPNYLSNDQRHELESMVTKEEVKRAVWDCGIDKSPGPDGFPFSFFRHFWATIEKDVFEAVDCFFKHGEMPNGCNSNFIALIPKILDANMVKDYRPISLIVSLYKIIAKILTTRLVGVIGDLVNEVQSAFVAERQILDGSFILNEVLQWCCKKKKHALIFKVDFEKAYDSVRWDFLDDVLNKFGFSLKWRNWIQSCLRSSGGSILINGSPTEEFSFLKALSKRVVDVGLFTGIKLNSIVNLSHFFYADDAIFIGQWSDLNIDTLVQVLDCFYRASGLKINMCKSKIMGFNVEDGKVTNTASKLGCLILKTPFTYLGTKVGSMPIFHMFIFKVPSNVLKTLESIRSRFFNGHDPKSKRASWVKWDNVFTSKNKGGLGVSSLYALNRGLLMKWVWRFYSQKTSLWTNVIKAIHGNDGKLGSEGSTGGLTCWTFIVQEMKVLKDRGINVMEFIRLKLGNGESTSFWDTEWHEGGILKKIVRSGVEEAQFNSLLEILQVTTLAPCEDRYRWTLESDGNFSVASIRKLIDGIRFQQTNALPTRFNLSRRGMDIETITCPICNGGVETTSHLFFQCDMVKQLMRKISSWWNIDESAASSYEEWCDWMESIRMQNKMKGILEGVCYGLWWSIWNFCNKHLFDKKIPKKAVIFDNFVSVSVSFSWCKYRLKASFKWDDWLKNPYFVIV